MEHEISHSSPGFGKNTNGMGIVLVAAVLVVFGLAAWNLWNSGATEKEWYRMENTAAAHGEAGHGEHGAQGGHSEEAHTAPAAADSTAEAPAAHDSTHAAEAPAADSSAH